MSRRLNTWLFVVLAVLTAFLAWRFIRPMNIFLVSDAFEKPVDTIETPATGKTQAAVLEAIVWYYLVGEKRRTRIGYENREPTAYQVFKQRVMLKRAEKNEQT